MLCVSRCEYGVRGSKRGLFSDEAASRRMFPCPYNLRRWFARVPPPPPFLFSTESSLLTNANLQRDWTQKCAACSHAGGDCTWQHNPANLGWACLSCRTRGIVCMPLDLNLLPLRNPAGSITVDPAILNIQFAPPAGNQAPPIPPAVAGGYLGPPAFVPPAGPGPAAPGGGLAGAVTLAARRGLRGTGAIYTSNELGETPEQQAAVQGRLQLDPNATICRTCFHNCNGSARRWCSRYGNPNAGLDACERCERCKALPRPFSSVIWTTRRICVRWPLHCQPTR